MSIATAHEEAPAANSIDELLQRPPKRPRHRWFLIALVVALLSGGGAAAAVFNPFGTSTPSHSGVIDNGAVTSFSTVKQQTISSQVSVDGTLDYADRYGVVNQAQGTITAVPDVGQIITQGTALYRVDNQPVLLLYGAIPIWRTLKEWASSPDVAQLNADLVTMGYLTTDDLHTSPRSLLAGHDGRGQAAPGNEWPPARPARSILVT